MKIIDAIIEKKGCAKAAIYARYSSDSQRSESIDAQIRGIREFAKRNDVEIVDIFKDEAKSGTNDNREGFQSMIAASRSGDFDIVLVHKLDRFARNRYDSIGYRLELKKSNVTLISILEQIDDNSPESVILESVLEAMSEYYSLNLAREVRKGLRENALSGKHTGGLPPLGYDVNPSTKKLIINEEEAIIVKLIFQRFIEGNGYNLIMKELNDLGYSTKKNKAFGKNSLYGILKNEKYIGNYIYNRSASKDENGKRNHHKSKDESEIIRIEGIIPSIIKKEHFELAKAKMEVRKPSAKSNEMYYLSSKLRCGNCGGSYIGGRRNAGRNKTMYVTYGCSTKLRKSRAVCDGKEVRKDYLERYVLEILADVVFKEESIGIVTEKYNQNTYVKADQDKQLIKKYRFQLQKVKFDIEKVLDLIIKVESASLIEKLSNLEEDKKSIEEKYNKLISNSEYNEVTEDEVRSIYLKAKQMMKDKTLPNISKFIELYLVNLVILDEEIEVEVYNKIGLNPLSDVAEIERELKKSGTEKETIKRRISRTELYSLYKI